MLPCGRNQSLASCRLRDIASDGVCFATSRCDFVDQSGQTFGSSSIENQSCVARCKSQCQLTADAA
jgi:hypothetical protein